MRAERDVMGVADGGDLLHAGDAARVRRVGLEIVGRAQLNRVENLLRCVEPLAAGYGRANARAYVGKRAHGVRNHRLLHPIRTELLERMAYAKRGGHVEAPMALD